MCGAEYNYNTILLDCQEGDKEKQVFSPCHSSSKYLHTLNFALISSICLAVSNILP